MAEYRKKPVVIQAIQMLEDNYSDVCAFSDGDIVPVPYWNGYECRYRGQKYPVDSGDWVIRYADGNLSTMKPDAFAKKFELNG